MRKEGFVIEQYFSQIKVNQLPDGKQPKFRVGDLVKIVFRSDDGVASYELKGDMALVCEVLFYQCRDYGIADYCDKNSYYLVEYKLLPSDSKEMRYVSEEYLRNVKND